MNKRNTKNWSIYLLLFVASILFITFWGFATLDTKFANPFSTFFVIIATFFIAIHVKKIKAKHSKMIFMSAPVFYVIMGLIMSFNLSWFQTFSIPIIWLFIVTCYAFNQKEISLMNTTSVVLFAIVFAFYIYPKTGFGKQVGYLEIVLKDEEQCQPNYNYNLNEFIFLNHQLDTVRFTTLNKPVLVETWNESCPPCIQSIKDMEEDLTANPNFDIIYLYQQRGKKWLSHNDVINYKFIKNKSNIYIDLNNEFTTYMNLFSMPYYLMFNPKGELMGTHKGYRSKHKEAFLEEMDNLVNL